MYLLKKNKSVINNYLEIGKLNAAPPSKLIVQQNQKTKQSLFKLFKDCITFPKQRSVSLKTETEVRTGDAETHVFTIWGFAAKLD